MSSSYTSTVRGGGTSLPPGRGRGRNPRVSDVLENKWRLFPYLGELQAVSGEFPVKLLWAGVAIESLQLLSFALMPQNNNWSGGMHGFTQALSITHVPFYDFLDIGLYGCLGVCAAFVLVYVLQTAYMVVKCCTMGGYIAGTNVLESPVFHLIRLFLYLTSSVLFVPLTQNLIALAYARQSHSNTTGAPALSASAWSGGAAPLVWFPSFDTNSAVAKGALAVCVIGLVLHVVQSYGMAIFMNEFHYSSPHPSARCYTALDGLSILHRFLCALLFHYFVATDNMMYFNVWMAVSSLVMMVGFMFYLPYYKETTNKLRIATLGVTVLYAIFSATTFAPGAKEFFQGERFGKHSIDLIIVLCGVPLFFFVFYSYVALMRVSRIYKSAFHALLHEARLSNPIVHIPKNLPRDVECLPENAKLLDALEDAITRTEGEKSSNVSCGSSNTTRGGQSARQNVSHRTHAHSRWNSGYDSAEGASNVGGAASERMMDSIQDMVRSVYDDDLQLSTVHSVTEASLVLDSDAASSNRDRGPSHVMQRVNRLRRTLGRFVAPYVDSILVPSDLELAARFLLPVREATGMPVSGHQARYAATIFLKGIAKYPREAFPRLAFHIFLMHMVRHPQLAAAVMAQSEDAQKHRAFDLWTVEPALALSFTHWRLQVELTQVMHLRESNRQTALKSAKDAHRDALHATTEFWMMLMGRGRSVEELSRSSRAMMRAHADGQRHYEALLSSQAGSMEIAACFAVFSDHIRDDKEMSTHCVRFLKQALAIRDGGSSAKISSARVKAAVAAALAQLKFSLASSHQTLRRFHQSSRVTFLRPTLVIFSLSSLALLVAVLVVVIQEKTNILHELKSLYYLGKLRSIAAQISVVARQIQASVNQGKPASRDLQGTLSAYKKDFSAMYNEVMFGSYSQSSTKFKNFFRLANVREVVPGFQLTLWASLGVALGAVEDIITRPDASQFMDWMANDFGGEASDALGMASEVYAGEFQRDLGQLRTRCIAIFSCVALLQVLGVLVVLYSVFSIRGVRSLAFALLRLIPLPEIRELYKRSAKQHLDLDAFLNQPTRAKVDGLLQLDKLQEQQRQLRDGDDAARGEEGEVTEASADRRPASSSVVGSSGSHHRGGARRGFTTAADTEDSLPGTPVCRRRKHEDHFVTAGGASRHRKDTSSTGRRKGGAGGAMSTPVLRLLGGAAVLAPESEDGPSGRRTGARVEGKHASVDARTRGNLGAGATPAKVCGEAALPATDPWVANSFLDAVVQGVARTRVDSGDDDPDSGIHEAHHLSDGSQDDDLTSDGTGDDDDVDVDIHSDDEENRTSRGGTSHMDHAAASSASVGNGGFSANASTTSGHGAHGSSVTTRPPGNHLSSGTAKTATVAAAVASSVKDTRGRPSHRRRRLAAQKRQHLEAVRSEQAYLLNLDANAHDAVCSAPAILLGVLLLGLLAAIVALNTLALPLPRLSGDHCQRIFEHNKALRDVKINAVFSVLNTVYFIMRGDMRYFNDYILVKGQDKWRILRGLVGDQLTDSEVAKLYFTLGKMLEGIEEITSIALTLACDKFASTCQTNQVTPDGVYISKYTWGDEESLVMVQQASRFGLYNTRFNILSGSDVDLSDEKDAETRVQMARQLLSSELVTEYMLLFFEKLDELSMRFDEPYKTLTYQYTAASTGLAVGGLVVCLLLMLYLGSYSRVASSKAVLCWPILASFCLIALIALGGIGLRQPQKLNAGEYMEASDEMSTTWNMVLFKTFWFPTMYAADPTHNMIWNYRFFELRRDFKNIHLLETLAILRQGEVRRSDEQTLNSAQELTMIGTALVYLATKDEPTIVPGSNMFDDEYLMNFTWDFKSEPDYLVTLATYGDIDRQFYSTREADEQLPNEAKLELAVDTLISHRQDAATETLYGFVLSSDTLVQGRLAADKSVLRGQQKRFTASIVVASVALFCFLAMACLVAVLYSISVSAVERAARGRGRSRREEQTAAAGGAAGALSTTVNGGNGVGVHGGGDSGAVMSPSSPSLSGLNRRTTRNGRSSVSTDALGSRSVDGSPRDGDALSGSAAASPTPSALLGLSPATDVVDKGVTEGNIINSSGTAVQHRESLLMRVVPFVAYGVILVVSVVLAVITAIFVGELDRMDVMLNDATQRDWVVAQSMYVGYSVRQDLANYAVASETLRGIYAKHTALTQQLYFGHEEDINKTRYAFVRHDMHQDQLLFERNKYYGYQKFYGLSISDTDSNGFQYLITTSTAQTLFGTGKGSSYSSSNAGNTVLLNGDLTNSPGPVDARFFCSASIEESVMRQISRGVGLMFDDVWPSYLRRTFTGGLAGFADAFADMEREYTAVMNGVAQSSFLFFNRAQSKAAMFFDILIALSVVLLALVILALLCVLMPLYNHLVREDTEYRLLMKVLPPEFRVRYPALGEFLMSSYRGSAAASRDANTNRVDATMTELAQSAVVAVDSDTGIVLRYNELAETLFGYSAAEVVGKHITTLIPCREADSVWADDHAEGAGLPALSSEEATAHHHHHHRESDEDIDVSAHGAKSPPTPRSGGGGGPLSASFAGSGSGAHNPSLHMDSTSSHAASAGGQPVVAAVPTVVGLLRRGVRVPQNLSLARKDGRPLTVSYTSQVVTLASEGSHVTVLQCKEVADRGELVVMEGVVQATNALNPDGILLMLMDGTLVRSNRAAAGMFGYEVEEIVNRNVRMLMPHDAALLFDAFLVSDPSPIKTSGGNGSGNNSGSKRRTSVRKVVNGVRKDGNHFRVNLVLVEIRSFAQSFFIGYLEDDTQGHDVEAAREIYQSVMNLSPTPVAFVSNTGRVLEMSKAACELLQWSPGEVRGAYVAAQLIAPPSRNDIETLFALATGSHGSSPSTSNFQNYNYVHNNNNNSVGSGSVTFSPAGKVQNVLARRRDQTNFPAEFTVHELYAGAGSLLTHNSFLTFITDTHKLREMDAQGQMMHSAMQRSVQPVVVMTAQGKIQYMNTAAEVTFQYAAKDVVGLPYTLLTRSSGFGLASGPPGVESIVLHSSRPTSAARSTLPATGHRQRTGSFPGPLVGLAVSTTSTKRLLRGGEGVTAGDSDASGGGGGITFDEKPIVVEGVKHPPRPHAESWLGDYARNPDDKSVFRGSRLVLVRRRDGTALPMELQLAELPPVHGTTQSLVAAFLHDATTRLERERRTMVNEALQSVCTSPILLVDGTGTLTQLSSVAETCFGYHASEVLGVCVDLLLPTIADTYRLQSGRVGLFDDGRSGRERGSGAAGSIDRSLQSLGVEDWKMLDNSGEYSLNHLGVHMGLGGATGDAALGGTGGDVAGTVAARAGMGMGSGPDGIWTARSVAACRFMAAVLADHAGKRRLCLGRRCDGRLFSASVRVEELKDLVNEAGRNDSGAVPSGSLLNAGTTTGAAAAANIAALQGQLYAIYCEDITELKEAESQAVFFHQICRNLDTPLVHLDADGNILSVNRVFEKELVYEPESEETTEFRQRAVGRNSFRLAGSTRGRPYSVANPKSNASSGNETGQPRNQSGSQSRGSSTERDSHHRPVRRCPVLGQAFTSLMVNPDAACRYRQLLKERTQLHAKRLSTSDNSGCKSPGNTTQSAGRGRALGPMVGVHMLTVQAASSGNHSSRRRNVRFRCGDTSETVFKCRIAEIVAPPSLSRGAAGAGGDGVSLPRRERASASRTPNISFVAFLNETEETFEDNFTGEDTTTTLLRTCPDALFITDHDGIIVQASPAAERLFGFAPASTDGAPLPLPQQQQQQQPNTPSKTTSQPSNDSEGTETIVGQHLKDFIVVSSPPTANGAQTTLTSPLQQHAQQLPSGFAESPGGPMPQLGSPLTPPLKRGRLRSTHRLERFEVGQPTPQPLRMIARHRDGHVFAVEVSTRVVATGAYSAGEGQTIADYTSGPALSVTPTASDVRSTPGGLGPLVPHSPPSSPQHAARSSHQRLEDTPDGASLASGSEIAATMSSTARSRQTTLFSQSTNSASHGNAHPGATQLFVTSVRMVEGEAVGERVERSLVATVEQLAIPVVITNYHGTIEVVNGALLRVFGYPSADALVGQDVGLLMTDEDAPYHGRRMQSYFQTGMRFAIDVTHLRAARKANGEPMKLFVRVKEVVPATPTTPSVADAVLGDAAADLGLPAATASAAAAETARSKQRQRMEDTKFVAYMTPATWVAASAVGPQGAANSVLRHCSPVPTGEFFDLVNGDHKNTSASEQNKLVPASSLSRRTTRRLEGWLGDEAGLPLAIMDDHGTTLRLSRAAQRSFGWSANEVTGAPLASVLTRDPQHTRLVETELQSMLAELHASDEEQAAGRADPHMRGEPVHGGSPVVRRLMFLQRRSGESVPIKVIIKEVVAVGEETFVDGLAARQTDFLLAALANPVSGPLASRIPLNAVVRDDGTFPEANASTGARGEDAKYAGNASGASHTSTTSFQALGNSTDLSMPRRVFVVLLLDLSGQVEAVHTKELHDATMALCPSPTIFTDTAGIVRLFNPAAEECFGWKAAEVLGRNVAVLMPAKTASVHHSFIQNFLRTGVRTIVNGVPRAITAKRKNGNEFSATLMLREVSQADSAFNKAGAPLTSTVASVASVAAGDTSSRTTHFFVGQIIDNSEMHCDEQLAQLTHTVVEGADEQVLLVIDAQDKIRLASPAALVLLGYDSVSDIAAKNAGRLPGEAKRETAGRNDDTLNSVRPSPTPALLSTSDEEKSESNTGLGQGASTKANSNRDSSGDGAGGVSKLRGDGRASINHLLPQHAAHELKDAIIKASLYVSGGAGSPDALATMSVEEEIRLVMESFSRRRYRQADGATTSGDPPRQSAARQFVLRGLQIRRRLPSGGTAIVTADIEACPVMCGSLYLGCVLRLSRTQQSTEQRPRASSMMSPLLDGASPVTPPLYKGGPRLGGFASPNTTNLPTTNLTEPNPWQTRSMQLVGDNEQTVAVAEGAIRHYQKPFFLLNKDGEVMRVSQALASLLGYASPQAALTQLQGRFIGSLLPPMANEPLTHFLTTMTMAQAAAASSSVQANRELASRPPRVVPAIRADGSSIDLYLVSFQALENVDQNTQTNEVCGYAGQVESVLVARSTAVSQQLPKALMELCPLPMLVLNPHDGTLLEVNSALLTAFDFMESQLLHHSLETLIARSATTTQPSPLSVNINHGSGSNNSVSGGGGSHLTNASPLANTALRQEGRPRNDSNNKECRTLADYMKLWQRNRNASLDPSRRTLDASQSASLVASVRGENYPGIGPERVQGETRTGQSLELEIFLKPGVWEKETCLIGYMRLLPS